MAELQDLTRNQSTFRKLKRVSKFCGFLIGLIGVLVFIGFTFNIHFFSRILTDTMPMNPVVALAFIAAGTCLVLHQEEYEAKYHRAANFLAGFILLIGVVKIISLATGLRLPFDELLFRKSLWLEELNQYRTIAPNTAFNLTLAGLAFLFINYETQKGRRPSQYLAIAITLLGLLSLYGYLYRVPALYEVKTFMPMAVNAAFGFVLLGAGILFCRPDRGSMSIVIGESSGQIIFMRFIAFLLPLVYGWLKIQGENAGLFTKEFGTALFALLTYLVSMFFLGRQSVLQHKIRETRRQAMAAIQENERRLQAILDNSATNISLKSVLGKYTLINKQFEKDFNLEGTQVLGKTDYDLFPRDMAKELNLYDHQIIRTGLPKSFEEKYPQKDGVHTYITVKFPLFTQEHKIYALGAVSTDITKRKQLEEELRLSEERYSLALKGTNDGLWDWNIAGNYLFLSERWKNMLGYEDHEISNSYEAWENQIHPEDREKTNTVIQDYFAKKTPVYSTEIRMRHKDGSYRWMLDRGMALWDESGKPYRMIGYQTDLTDRKRLESELRKSHQRLFSILDNIGEGVIVVDKDGNLLIFNGRAEEILGTGAVNAPLEEWNKVYGFYHEDGESYFSLESNPLFKAMKGESADNVEMLVKNVAFKEGKWIAVTGRPVFDQAKQVIAGVIIFRDISLRKQLEKSFRENEKRLKLILSSIGEGVIIVNQAEHILLFNKKAEELLGTGPRDLPVLQWATHYGIFQPDGTKLYPVEELPLTRALKGMATEDVEVLIKNQNLPEGKHICLSGKPIKDPQGNLTGAILDIKDVTEQRKLEEYLKEIESQFHNLVNVNTRRPSV